MADREMVLRFLAFVLNDPEQYSSTEFDTFLSDVMGQLNIMDDSELSALSRRFAVAMQRSEQLFGRYAFRKQVSVDGRRQPINKALFESWSVNLDGINDEQMTLLCGRKEELTRRFVELINNPLFLNAVSQGTGDVRKVQLRFQEIKRIIEETLDDKQFAH
jgi:hypothetical protein